MHLIRNLAASGALLAFAAVSLPVHAHGLDRGRLTLELEAETVRLVATPPSSIFATADDDRDGLLDVDEVRAHREQMRQAFDETLSITDGEGHVPTCAVTDVSTPGSGGSERPRPSDHVRVTRVCRFASKPGSIVVTDALAREAPMLVEAVRVSRISPDRWEPEGVVERAALDAHSATARLLTREAPMQANPPSRVRAVDGFDPWLLALAIAWGARIDPRSRTRRRFATSR